MREIPVGKITEVIKEMCIRANCCLGEDIENALKEGLKREEKELPQSILSDILENARIAREKGVPICQDTGMAVIFLEIGQEVHFTDGLLYDAVNEGVRRGYKEGYLRKSVVSDPVKRGNTEDNTPAVIHTEITNGDKVKITLAPKGFGSENMSRIKMLKPGDGYEGIIDFVVETVKKGGSNPCPPIVVGVGIGGTFEKAAILAKKALLRDIRQDNSDDYYAQMEKELLEKINSTGIGPQGFGGKTTALGVNVEAFPTHIAGMPVAVNISCHVTRHLVEIV